MKGWDAVLYFFTVAMLTAIGVTAHWEIDGVRLQIEQSGCCVPLIKESPVPSRRRANE